MWKLITSISLTCGMLTAVIADEPAAKPKPDVSVEFCGRLRHGVMAIGGESTGTNISYNRIIWELQLHNDTDRKFAEQHHKKTVVVTGSLRKVAGIETEDRWVIDVKKLSEQDTTKDKEGVQMAILGTLKTVASKNGKPASMVIDSAGLVWPVDLSSDGKLKSAAETMIGQQIILTGALKPESDDTPQATRKALPPIHVTNLKQQPNLSRHDELD